MHLSCNTGGGGSGEAGCVRKKYIHISKQEKSTMFRNMKVGFRLALGFTIVLVIMIAIIGVSLWQANVSHEDLTRIVEKNNVRIHLANNMIDDARDTAIVIRNILLATHSINDKSLESAQKNKDHLAEIWKEYVESVATLEHLITKDDAKGFDLFRKVDRSATAARQLQDQVIELVEVDKYQEAVDFMTTKAYPAVKQWISDTDDLIHHNEERNAFRYAEAEAVVHYAFIIMSILGVAAIGLSVLIIFVLNLSITRPLSQIVQAANRIAAGDLSGDIILEEKRGDEIGLLMQSMNTMVATIKALVTDTATLSRAAVAGKLGGIGGISERLSKGLTIPSPGWWDCWMPCRPRP
jgi:methyl-accepting chemotaxis protein